MSYLLQKSKLKDHWVCTDEINKIVVLWKQGAFNETQKVTLLDDFNGNDYMQLARFQRKLGEWLVKNHSDKI